MAERLLTVTVNLNSNKVVFSDNYLHKTNYVLHLFWQQCILFTCICAYFRFDDEGYGAVNADVSLLTAGFIIVFVFIILVLGKFNLVEHKVCTNNFLTVFIEGDYIHMVDILSLLTRETTFVTSCLLSFWFLKMEMERFASPSEKRS